MKITIKGHPTRGKEVIQILEGLGGKNEYEQSGSNERFIYFINSIGLIYSVTQPMFSSERRIYTLEEFEKEFPFKVGDKVIDHEGDVAIITGFAYIEEKLGYSLQYENGRGTATSGILKPYKEMKEERNITLTLEKAKEWYNKGGELREIALQAFTEKELTKVDLPKTWKEFCMKYPTKKGESYVGSLCEIVELPEFDEGRDIKMDRNNCPSKKSAEAHLAMIQLEQLRNCWWNDWKPDWNNDQQTKYCVVCYHEEFKISTLYETRHFLSFPTKEMAKEFLECFRDLIEKARDLI